MSEKMPNPTQMNIDRKGGLYDQATKINIERDGGLYDEALSEDAERAQILPDNPNNTFLNYVSEQILHEGARQSLTVDQDDLLNHIADQTLEADVKWQQKHDQDEAYATYTENIEITQAREEAEYRANKKELRKAKRKLLVGKLGAMAMFIPGVDVIADIVKEEVTTVRLNQNRRENYKMTNGTLFGNSEKGYTSTLRRQYRKDTERFDKQKRIIKDLSELLKQQKEESNTTRV